MRTRTMRALLWKDFRVNRPILIIGVVLWLVPYVFLLANEVASKGVLSSRYSRVVYHGAQSSIVWSILIVALLGGNVIARERVTRSAAFIAYLPPSRLAVLISKAICGIAPCFLLHFLIVQFFVLYILLF